MTCPAEFCTEIIRLPQAKPLKVSQATIPEAFLRILVIFRIYIILLCLERFYILSMLIFFLSWMPKPILVSLVFHHQLGFRVNPIEYDRDILHPSILLLFLSPIVMCLSIDLMLVTKKWLVFAFSCITFFIIMMTYSWSVVALEIALNLLMCKGFKDLFPERLMPNIFFSF